MHGVWRYLEPSLVQRLDRLQLTARSIVAGATAGERRSPLRGASIEFRQHRRYALGDDIRSLDWRVLARTERPFVREYHEESNLRAVMMIDSSGSMGYGSGSTTKLEYAVRLAAAISYLMLSCREAVGVAAFSSQIDRWIAPQSSTAQLGRLFDVFARLEAGGRSAIDEAAMSLAQRLPRRSLVLVLSDLLAPIALLRRALARLHHDRHEVIVIQVLHQDEMTFPFHGFTRFRGLEAERHALVDGALLRKLYLERLSAHLSDAQAACRAHRASLFRFTTDQAVDESVIDFVRRWGEGR